MGARAGPDKSATMDFRRPVCLSGRGDFMGETLVVPGSRASNRMS